MITTQEVRVHAQHPSMPLNPFTAFKNSPSSIRVLDVPKKIGLWNITSVQIQVTYPDSHIVSKDCVRTGNVWVGTLEGTSAVGSVCKGWQITASGVDEDGNEVSGYVLGVGDVVIMELDGSIYPSESADIVKIFDEQPADPKKGDIYLDGNYLMVYDGTAWTKVGWQDMSGFVKIGNNQLSPDQNITVTNGQDDVAIKADRIKVAKRGGGTTLTHNTIQMFPQYGSSQIIVGDSMYGGVVKVGDNAVVIQGDSQSSSIKLNGNKVLTENQIVPDTNNTGYAQNATSATKAGQDGNGNNIATTYATKTYVDEQIGNVLTQEEF